MITNILTDEPGQTGVYYHEGGRPMQSSALVREPKFQDRVVAQTPLCWPLYLREINPSVASL